MEFQSKAVQMKENVSKVIVGKGNVTDLILTALIAGGHVLLEDVPGTGKTMIAKSFAKSIDAEFARIQFTPDLLPSDITGINYYNQKQGEFVFRKGPVFSNILLADEINRATPRTQSALLECMEEHQVTVDGETRKLGFPFIVIATQNPIGSIGTQKLPESQMDRFMVKLSMGYPSVEDEITIMKSRSENDKRKILSECVLDNGDIQAIKEAVSDIYVDDSIYEYVANIVDKTRHRENIIQGVSPRGSISIISMAKAEAFLRGNEYVLPSDIKNIAVDTLAHRLITNVAGAAGNEAAKKEITDILRMIPVPKMQEK